MVTEFPLYRGGPYGPDPLWATLKSCALAGLHPIVQRFKNYGVGHPFPLFSSTFP